MTRPSMLRELFRHNDWANDELLALARALDRATLAQRHDGLGSLGETLHHLWQAERGWLAVWWQAPRPAAGAGSEDVDDLAARFQEVRRERDAFLDAGRSETHRIGHVTAQGKRFEYPLGDMMLHLANHGIHHRARALVLLRRLSGTAPTLDYIVFRLLRPTVAGVKPLGFERFGVAADGAAQDEPARFDLETLREYFRYTDWARGRVHAAVTALPDEALDRPLGIGPGTLRLTLAHILEAEQWWTGAALGEDPSSIPELDLQIPVAELEARFEETVGARERLLGGLGDGDLDRVVRPRPTPGLDFAVRLGEMLLQLCAHGSHHRAQAGSMLRLLGVAPPALDYIRWLDQVARPGD